MIRKIVIIFPWLTNQDSNQDSDFESETYVPNCESKLIINCKVHSKNKQHTQKYRLTYFRTCSPKSNDKSKVIGFTKFGLRLRFILMNCDSL